MNLWVVFWLMVTTSGASVITIVKKCFDIVKDLANLGYKMTFDNSEKMQTEEVSGIDDSFWGLLIPGYNLWFTYKMLDTLNIEGEHLIDIFRVSGLIDKMSNLELQEYRKNPTAINALNITNIVKKRIASAKTLVVNDFGLEGTIIYDYEDGELNILETTGTLLYLNDEKRRKLVQNNGVLYAPDLDDDVIGDKDGQLLVIEDTLENSNSISEKEPKLTRTKKYK